MSDDHYNVEIGGTEYELDDEGRLPPLSIRGRLLDFIARLHREPAICRHCGAETEFRKLGPGPGAWTCPYEFREDHLIIIEEELDG